MLRPLTMDMVQVHVPSINDSVRFRGIHAEEEADTWLRRHVQKNVAWEWVVQIEVRFEQAAFAVKVDHRVRPGHTNGSIRDAVVAYFIDYSRDESLPEETRTSAHALAHGVKGEPLPVPVMRQTWDLDTWGLVLKPAPHQYHSEVSGSKAPSDTRRPFQRTH